MAEFDCGYAGGAMVDERRRQREEQREIQRMTLAQSEHELRRQALGAELRRGKSIVVHGALNPLVSDPRYDLIAMRAAHPRCLAS